MMYMQQKNYPALDEGLITGRLEKGGADDKFQDTLVRRNLCSEQDYCQNALSSTWCSKTYFAVGVGYNNEPLTKYFRRDSNAQPTARLPTKADIISAKIQSVDELRTRLINFLNVFVHFRRINGAFEDIQTQSVDELRAREFNFLNVLCTFGGLTEGLRTMWIPIDISLKMTMNTPWEVHCDFHPERSVHFRSIDGRFRGGFC